MVCRSEVAAIRGALNFPGVLQEEDQLAALAALDEIVAERRVALERETKLAAMYAKATMQRDRAEAALHEIAEFDIGVRLAPVAACKEIAANALRGETRA